MTLSSHGIAGLYWVGTVEQARRSGLGRAVTAAVTNIAFDRGASLVTLQASVMGEPVYRVHGLPVALPLRGLGPPSQPPDHARTARP